MSNKKDRNNNNQKKIWKLSKIFRKQTEKINYRQKYKLYLQKNVDSFQKKEYNIFHKVMKRKSNRVTPVQRAGDDENPVLIFCEKTPQSFGPK